MLINAGKTYFFQCLLRGGIYLLGGIYFRFIKIYNINTIIYNINTIKINGISLKA